MFDLTGGTDGLGGLQPGTIKGGASAAYFNPSLLVDLPFGLSIGFLVVTEQIGVSLASGPGPQFDVPDGIANATHANGSSIGNVPIPTMRLQNGRPANSLTPALAARPRQGASTGHQTTAYETVGFVAKLLDNRLALGFYGLIPNGNFTNLDAFYADEREQYFSNSLHPELYGDRLTAVSLGFGTGYKLSDELALGLGASLVLKAGVGAPTFVANAGALQNLLVDTNGTDAGAACAMSIFSETCPPRQTCVSGACKALCFCNADCPMGQCCSDLSGPKGFTLCGACP